MRSPSSGLVAGRQSKFSFCSPDTFPSSTSSSSCIVPNSLSPSLLIRLTHSKKDLFRVRDTTTCSDIYQTITCSFYVGTALAKSCVSHLSVKRFLTNTSLSVILTLRTWAVWDRGRKLGFGLAILFVVCWGTIIPFIVLYIRDLDCEKTYFAVICTVSNTVVLQVLWVDSPALSGCSIVKGSHFATVCWVLLLVYETGVFLIRDATASGI